MQKEDKDSINSNGSDSNSSNDDDDDMEEENELIPHRPELQNLDSQTIELLIPPSTGPSHPRTVYFRNDPELNEDRPLTNFKTVKVTITEKKYMFLYKLIILIII